MEIRDSGNRPAGAFSPDGKTLAVAGNSTNDIRLWNMATWQELGSLRSYDQRVSSPAFLNDGKALAAIAEAPGSGRWEVFLWGERPPLPHTEREQGAAQE